MTRRIPLASVPNMRDLGGLPADGGNVRVGEIYRSTMLANLSDTDLPTFEGLGIKVVFDLRTEGEYSLDPDKVPAGIEILNLDVLADNPTNVAATLGDLTSNPEGLTEALGAGKAEEMMKETYRGLISLPSAKNSYHRFFETLADPARTGAALFHCTTGKDRTGWAAASFLLLLGADEQTVREDYLQTNTDLAPALQPLADAMIKQGVDPELLAAVLGVRESYLDAALEEVSSRYGTMESYFTAGLELSDSTLDALRSRFIG